MKTLLVLVVIALATAATASADLSPAASKQAQANVHMAVTAMEVYGADHGTYRGATSSVLRRYDRGLPRSVRVAWAKRHYYCIDSTVKQYGGPLDGQAFSYFYAGTDKGPAGTIRGGRC